MVQTSLLDRSEMSQPYIITVGTREAAGSSARGELVDGKTTSPAPTIASHCQPLPTSSYAAGLYFVAPDSFLVNVSGQSSSYRSPGR